MLKLVVLLSSFVFAFGAIYNLPDLSNFDDNDIIETQAKYTKKADETEGDKIWVLELDDEGLDLKTLKPVTANQRVVFERVVQPMIEASKYRPARVVKESVKESTQESRELIEKRNKKMKQEMMRLINKFAMSITSDPDAFLSDSSSAEDSGPSLVLYVKGAYTSLTVSSKLKEWHFFIPPPSPLPGWLYQQNSSAGSVDVPDHVRDQLFVKLLHLLQMLLGLTV